MGITSKLCAQAEPTSKLTTVSPRSSRAHKNTSNSQTPVASSSMELAASGLACCCSTLTIHDIRTTVTTVSAKFHQPTFSPYNLYNLISLPQSLTQSVGHDEKGFRVTRWQCKTLDTVPGAHAQAQRSYPTIAKNENNQCLTP